MKVDLKLEKECVGEWEKFYLKKKKKKYLLF